MGCRCLSVVSEIGGPGSQTAIRGSKSVILGPFLQVQDYSGTFRAQSAILCGFFSFCSLERGRKENKSLPSGTMVRWPQHTHVSGVVFHFKKLILTFVIVDLICCILLCIGDLFGRVARFPYLATMNLRFSFRLVRAQCSGVYQQSIVLAPCSCYLLLKQSNENKKQPHSLIARIFHKKEILLSVLLCLLL
jgi:hypothetical protein